MKDFSFLKTMTLKQLIALKDSTNDEDLKENILALIGTNQEKYSSHFYSSDRTEQVTKELDKAYLKVIKSVKINDLDFFVRLVCNGKGNNIGINSSCSSLDQAILIYEYPEAKELIKQYGIKKILDFFLLYNNGWYKDYFAVKERAALEFLKMEDLIKEAEHETQYLRYLEEFFKDEKQRKLYEGVYNSYMYIKEYIYKCLALNPESSLEEIFADYQRNRELITIYFQEICSYLLNIRRRIPNSRLSAFNNKIAFAARYKYDTLNEIQSDFAKLLALGTSRENLENKNFEDMERLVYIPKRFF